MRNTQHTQGGMPQRSESCKQESSTYAATPHTEGSNNQSIMKTQLMNINTAVMRLGMLVLMVFAVQANAQMIPNPSFETFTACPTDFSDLIDAASWFPPTDGSTDYFNCSFTPSSPYNILPAATAQNGTGFTGQYLEAYDTNAGGVVTSDLKEYMTSPLSVPMVAGRVYTLQFYIRFAIGTANTLNHRLLPTAERGFYGAMFSKTAPTSGDTTTGTTGSIMSTFPSSASGGKVLLPSTDPAYSIGSTWSLVTLTYTAVGGEKYMTIGQFRPGSTSMANKEVSYVFVDNFSLTSTIACKTGGSTVTFTANTSLGDPANTTSYILTDAAGVILNTSISPSGFTAPGTAGTYNIYSVNYSGTLTGNTAGSNITGVSSSTNCAVKTPASFCVTTACIATSVPIIVN